MGFAAVSDPPVPAPAPCKLTVALKSGRADDQRSTPWSMHCGDPHDRNPGCARPPSIKQALCFLQPIGLDVGASGRSPTKRLWIGSSSGEPEFMEDAFHCNSDGLVVGVDRFWVVRRACWVEKLSGGQEGFDSFVSEYEQRSHRSEPSWERLVARGSDRCLRSWPDLRRQR